MPLFSVRCEPAFRQRAWEKSPRILLESDAASADSLAELLCVADESVAGSLQGWRSGKVPPGFDGVLSWLAGEELLAGSPAALRHQLRSPGRRTFLVVHRPCLTEMPLLALEPRALARGARQDYRDTRLRIASPAAVSPMALEAIRGSGEVWARLSAALIFELAAPGGGIDALLALWQRRTAHSERWAALAARNLFVALLRLQQPAAAEKILQQAQATFPGYAELWCMGAFWHFFENRPAQAFASAEKARAAESGWAGVGGEGTFRADWLLGVLARRAGNERAAFEHLRRAMQAKPLFSPAAEEMLGLRLPRRLLERQQAELCFAALADPRLLGPVFDLFLQRQVFSAAGQLLAAAPLDGKTRSELLERLRHAQAPRTGSDGRPAAIMLSGPLFEHTSLGRINREIAAGLLEEGRPALSWDSPALGERPAAGFPGGARLEAALARSAGGAALTIRHQWPPDFRRPPEGRLAVILPWEYGALPRAWVQEIEENVDELWVPSRFVREVLRRAGVSRTPIEVIPNGFDPAVFRPEGPAARPPGCRGCLLLFVGGAIRRKGLDLLLEAYEAAFDPGEDVTLAVYASGAQGSYRHNSLTESLQAFARDPRRPHLQLLSEFLDDDTLARLYRGCDALALPYRGEGFGMPLLEAMACGKPVIATAAGPASEFCDQRHAYLLPSREAPVPDEPPPLGPLSGEFTWFEPDFAALAGALRRVFENRSEAAARGRAAALEVRRTHTWEQVSELYRRRVRRLLEAPDTAGAPGPCGQRHHLSSARP